MPEGRELRFRRPGRSTRVRIRGQDSFSSRKNDSRPLSSSQKQQRQEHPLAPSPRGVEERLLGECLESNPRNPWKKWCVDPGVAPPGAGLGNMPGISSRLPYGRPGLQGLIRNPPSLALQACQFSRPQKYKPESPAKATSPRLKTCRQIARPRSSPCSPTRRREVVSSQLLERFSFASTAGTSLPRIHGLVGMGGFPAA